MQSLYHTCIQRLAQLADQELDLSDVPFDPYLSDLLHEALQTRSIHLIHGALESIGRSHGRHLQTHMKNVASVCLEPSYRRYNQRTVLQTVRTRFPHGICNLNLSHCDAITDADLVGLKQCVNLQVLDLSYTGITDSGVATLARITALTEPHLGLKQLELLGLAGNRLSDRSLKYLVSIERLRGMDLSYTTDVNADIAVSYLARSGYAVLPRHIRHLIGWSDDHDETCQCSIPAQNELTRLMQASMYPASAPPPSAHAQSNGRRPCLCLVRQQTERKGKATKRHGNYSAATAPAAKKQRRDHSIEDYVRLVEQEMGLLS